MASSNPLGSTDPSSDDDSIIEETNLNTNLQVLPGSNGKVVFAGLPATPSLQTFVFFSPDEAALRELEGLSTLPWWIRMLNYDNGTGLFEPVEPIQLPRDGPQPEIGVGAAVRTQLPVAWRMFTTVEGVEEAILLMDLDNISFTDSLADDTEVNTGNVTFSPSTVEIAGTKFSTRTRVLVVVVPTGAFDSRSSSVFGRGGEIESSYVIEVRLDDPTATALDIAFLVLYVSIILWLCVCWKCCNSGFHAMMAHVVPELYTIKITGEQQRQDRDRFTKDALKLIVLPTAGVVLGILRLALSGIDDLPPLIIPKKELHANVNLRQMLGWLAGYLIRDIDAPIVRVDDLKPFVSLTTLVRAMGLHLPEDIEVPKASLEGLQKYSISPLDLLKNIRTNFPDLDMELGTFSIYNVHELLEYFQMCVPVDRYLPSTHDIDITNREIDLPAIVVLDPDDVLDLIQRVVSLMREFHVDGVTPPMLRLLLKRAHYLEGMIPNPGDMDWEYLFEDVPVFKIEPKTLNVSRPPKVELPDLSVIDITVGNVNLPGQIDANIDLHELRNLIGKTRVRLVLQLVLSFFFVLIGNVMILFIEFLGLMFNITIIHSALQDIGVTVPDAELLILSFDWAGDLAQLIDLFKKLWSYMNLVQVFESFNCGGTLTMASPLLFFVGASFVWVILQKDILLWLGIRLRLDSASSAKTKLIAKKFWEGASKLAVRISLIVMQSIIYALAQAAIYSSTQRSCSDVDFFANTIGKGIVAFFYVFFYIMLAFAFTGAPDLQKYKNFGLLRTWGMMFIDGLGRFLNLTAGIWTDATIRSYNILGRAARYKRRSDDIGKQEHMDAISSVNDTAAVNALEAKHQAKRAAGLDANDTLHEVTMQLIAASRNVLWIPLPAGVIITKFSETLNQAHVFLFNKTEQVQLRRGRVARWLTWGFSVSHVPLQLTVIFTTSSGWAAVLASTLIPLHLLRLPYELIGVVRHFRFYWNTVNEKDHQLHEMM
jgi:hypothetical protein